MKKSLSLFERLNSDSEPVKKAAFAELEKAADQFGLTPKALYTRMSDAVIKREGEIKEAVSKGERKSAIDFTDTFMPIRRDAAMDDDSDADDKKRKLKDAAMDDDADTDDKKSAKDMDDDDSKLKLKGGARGVDKSKVRRGVSFKSVVMGDSREFPIEDQPQARQPRGADEGSDTLNRSFQSDVAARIAGAFSGVNEVEDSQLPVAGMGPDNFEGTTQDIPVRQFGKVIHDGPGSYVGGEHRPGELGKPGARDGAYSLEVEGAEPGSGIVRSGPNYILPGLGGSGASAPLFVKPEPATAVTKTAFDGAEHKIKRGTFSSAIKGPEAGASDGQDTL